MKAALCFLFSLAALHAQGTYVISTMPGGPSTLNGYSGDGGPATQARLNRPTGLALGRDGTLYIADTMNHVIRAVDRSGIIRTIAGNGTEGFAGDGGPATQARLLFPESITLDSQDNLYIADTQNHRLRRVSKNGIIETFAGNGEPGSGGDSGPATKAQIDWPSALIVDGTGTVFFADLLRNTIRKITPDGVIHTIVRPPRNAPDSATLDGARGLAMDSLGVLYIADTGHHRVARINGGGAIVGSTGFNESGPFSLVSPSGLAFDNAGNLLVASDRIYRLDRNGNLAAVAESELRKVTQTDGNVLGVQRTVFNALAVEQTGVIYATDTLRHRVLRIDPSGVVTIVAGLTKLPEPASADQLSSCGYFSAIAVGPTGDVFVADSELNRVCRMTPDGKYYRVAGKDRRRVPIEGPRFPGVFSGDGGLATFADLDDPGGIVMDSEGNVLIADTWNHRIRKVSPDGIIRTIAGNGRLGFDGDGGPAIDAVLASPKGLALDSAGDLYIADSLNDRIRKITTDGKIKTVVGGGKRLQDGPALSVKLQFPQSVAISRDGTLYLADTANHLIRKLTSDGAVQTVAGSGKAELKGDGGPALKAGMVPLSVAVDSHDNIFVADQNWRIRKITPDGIIRSIAGSDDRGFSRDGPALKAPIFPSAITVDAAGTVYITEDSSVRVLKEQTQ